MTASMAAARRHHKIIDGIYAALAPLHREGEDRDETVRRIIAGSMTPRTEQTADCGAAIDPCPFDGGKGELFRVLRDGCQPGEPDAWAYFVRCVSCAAEGPWQKNLPYGAVRQWNMRQCGRAR